MHFDPAVFRIDPTPRRADGEYMAHAMISGPLPDGESFIHVSGDLAGFDLRQDAICHRLGERLAAEMLRRFVQCASGLNGG